jgi:hypothetical protein
MSVYNSSLTTVFIIHFAGLELMRRFDVYETLQCDEATFKGWLIVIENHYRSTNTYHNSTHAADVMQVSVWFIENRQSGKLIVIWFVCLLAGNGGLPATVGQSRY